ncbi:MAG: hypothetical protein O2985_08580, partial [Proteobacteria bacterium]|nr:hypothetical protein [Pseudomonadota bacterium]
MSRTVDAILAHAQQLATHHRHREAINQLSAALLEFSNDPRLQFALANQHSAIDSHEEAARIFRLVLQSDPLSIPALVNLAGALMRQGCGHESESHARKAVLLVPDHPTVLQRLADAVSMRRQADSIRHYRRLIVLAPDSAAAQVNLAEALSQTHSDDTAGPYYLAAMKRAPDAPLIRFNYAKHLLCRGHTREGWAYYESRLSPDIHDAPERVLTVPPWRGEPLAGKALLVCSEQGLGDEVRFAPYLHRLSELADTVIMEVDPRMLPIYQRSMPAITFHPFRRTRVRGRMRFTYDWLRKFPTPDFHAPLLSMPHLLQDDHAAPLSPRGYLTPLPSRVDAIGAEVDRLANGEGPRIGLVWTSGLISTNRAASYAPLDHWRSLLNHPT